ncbi:hypothetical protein AXA44_01390 [Rhodococcus sp. SC4]|nr:hypothetical protein AXA44_01390 [Rhodococcus sp. SC4]
MSCGSGPGSGHTASAPGDHESSLGRRGFLRAALAGGAALTGAGMLAACASTDTPAAAGPVAPSSLDVQGSKLTLVLLGTKAGPPPAAERVGISSALVVDGKTYLIDCGRSAVTQYKKSGLKYGELEGIFLTHLHADHVADYYNFFMMAGTTGERNGDVTPTGIPVYGPGSAGGLPVAQGGRTVPTVAPQSPTPGTREMTDRLHEAYAYTSNLFLRDAGFRDPRDIPDVREITIPSGVGARWDNTAPDMAPFTVMEDDRVKVTATLVPHGPVFPSFAFRFDTDHGSVTFSGDTRYSENLITLANSSNILVHEALRIPPDSGLTEEIIDHHRKSHVFVEDVGPIAQKANVPSLVLSHIEETGGRTIDAQVWSTEAQRGYDGTVTVGEDLMTIPVVRM